MPLEEAVGEGLLEGVEVGDEVALLLVGVVCGAETEASAAVW